MSRKCSVQNCNSFDGECALFSVPKTSVKIWTDIVSSVNGSVTNVKFIREKHFLQQDVIRNYSGIEDIPFSKRKVFRLVKEAYITNSLTYLDGNSSNASEESLTNLKSRGYLIHPNRGFFNLIYDLEDSFEIYCDNEYAFQDSIDDFLSNNCHISFPCLEHRTEILTYMICYYVTMRMRQHATLKNRELKNNSCHFKKKSKLVKH